jgi:hypothetical protein
MTLHSDRVIALLEQGGLAALQAERERLAAQDDAEREHEVLTRLGFDGLAELLDSGYLQKRASRP